MRMQQKYECDCGILFRNTTRNLGGKSIMDNKTLKGIALILFGILLCAGDAEINNTLLRSFDGFPFSLLGVIIGAVGLAMIFIKDMGKKDT